MTAAVDRWAAHVWIPSGRRGSNVDDVAEVSRLLLRTPLDDWQLEAVDIVTSYGRLGMPLALEAAAVLARQNGKTFGIGRPIAVAECLFGPPSLSTWTAQLLDTCLDTFRELRDLGGRKPDGTPYDEDLYVPEFGDYVVRVSEKDGEEGLEFVGGSELAFRARSGRSGRGRRPRRLYADEALFMTLEEAAAIVPGMGRQGPTAQILYMSSPALAASSYLHDLVRRGRSQRDPSLLYVEHCAPGSFEEPTCRDGKDCDHHPDRAGCAADSEDNWRAGNPAYRTGAMTSTYLVGARRALKAAFVREHLGWHEPETGARETISKTAWGRLADAYSRVRKGTRPVFAVMVRPDQSSAAIAVSGERSDGKVHVGLIRNAVKIGDVVDEVAKLNGKHQPRLVVLCPGPSTKRLKPQLEAAGVRVRVATEAELAQAVGTMVASVTTRDTRHRGDELVEASLEASRPRKTSDGGWTVDLKAQGDSAPFVTLMLARWGVAIGPRSYDPNESAW